MRENMLLLGFIFFALAEFQLGEAQRSSCSRDRMRQCSDMILRTTQRRIVDVSRSEMSSLCTNVRDDFNCLLRETRCLTSENERNRNGDTLRNALKYIRDGCDTNGASWRDSSCYVGDAMKTCESSYPLGGVQYSSYNAETCRKFTLFQDCVMEAVRSRCRSDDERFLGQYLVDTAQDLAWNCGEASSSSDWDRSRDDRYDRDRYDRNGNYDRDRDRDSGRNSDRNSDRDSGRNSDRDRDRSRGDSWRDRDRGNSRDRDWDRTSDRNDRNGGYDRNGDRSGDRNYDRGYGSSGGNCCRNERCGTSRMQQCRDSLSRSVDSRSSGYQDSQKCRQTRDDFNCLLWQTSNCAGRNEKDRDNDLFRRARDFISKNCDTYGRWSENSCYKSTEMQRCENGLSSTRSGASYDSCRSYNNFRECMEDELRRRCTREDELYQGAYLVDKAQELSWQCGDDQNNGRNQYYTDNRRDPYDSGYNDRYDSSPEHLEDEDAMCLSRIQAYSDQCKEKFDEKRRDFYITNEYEARKRLTCCSAREYRSCLLDATRRVCSTERKRVVDSVMGRYSHELNSDNCRRIYDGDCNSGTHNELSTILLLCAVILPMFFFSHLK